jgi:hypothetical protein
MREKVLMLNRWPQYRGGQRWENELSRPEDLIDQERYHVTYICNPNGQSGVPVGAEDVHFIQDFNRVDDILKLTDKLVSESGPYDYVIGFSEYLLDLAAVIRERYGIPGLRSAEVNRFRDKTIMKAILAEAGVPVPRWAPCQALEQVFSDAGSLGFPLIFKPVRGASSQGVHKIASMDELRTRCTISNLNEYEIEQYVTGDLLHADGVVDRHGKCLFMSISRYISDCLAFEHGEPLGSVIQTDELVQAQCRPFVLRCLSALKLRESAFHLEFFDTGRGLVFLEVGARVPGADVPYVIRDVFGVNLYRLWVDVMLGNPVEQCSPTSSQSGGWLMIPRPQPLPQKVVDSAPLMGEVPFLYRELVPKPGDVLEQTGGYATLQGGRFLFRGGTQEQITDAMNTALTKYTLTAVPLAGVS